MKSGNREKPYNGITLERIECFECPPAGATHGIDACWYNPATEAAPRKFGKHARDRRIAGISWLAGINQL
jgi:hypothetical protein